MRLHLGSLGMALLVVPALFSATASSHTIHCAGRALSANKKDLTDAITYLHWMADGKLWHSGSVPNPEKVHTLDPNFCEQIACIKHAEVRWCNEDPVNSRSMHVQHIAEGATALLTDCKDTYKGKDVAGGYLTHDDHWSVVVQEPKKCESKVFQGRAFEA
ncbi:hypothetical protein BDW74DRAFT_177923 [Aspergillus multicolor]|uniref:uncharacterized protein n=1 Tax=Aspergillus multicolor TaxID=41759 RepID=UPI003CCDD815